MMPSDNAGCGLSHKGFRRPGDIQKSGQQDMRKNLLIHAGRGVM